MHPPISIITPSYNQGRYLEENILSVINQKYPNVEHIIIDGGSTDNTKEVLEKYKGKLAYSVSEPDKGQSDAVNKGFAKATGDIIGWLNSDDYYAPEALNAVSKAFSDPSINVVCGYSILFDEKGKKEKAPPTLSKTQTPAQCFRFPNINQPSTFFRKNILAEFIPLNISLHYTMDRELWLKYLLRYGIKQVAITDETLVYFRVHKNSKSMSKETDFDNEYATMLRWFAYNYNLIEIAAQLSKRYNILNTYNFSCNKRPDKETTLNMIRYFFLHRGGLVFDKKGFDYAKKMYPLLKFEEYALLPKEVNRMKKILDIQSCVNWVHFRAKRKYKHLLTRSST